MLLDRSLRVPGSRLNPGSCLVAGVVLLGACSAVEDPAGARRDSTAREPDVAAIGVPEYVERRSAILASLSDGILLLQARPVEKSMEQWGFVQDPAFQYYTGIAEIPGAIIALDGPSGRSLLFLPPAPESFGMSVGGIVPEAGPGTARSYGVDEARPWTEFAPWLRDRIGSGAVVYLDGSRRPEARGTPPGTRPVAGPRTLWREWIEGEAPSVRIRSAKGFIMEQRAVKSAAEVAILERNARLTVRSLLAVAERLEPGVHQRSTEAAMVATCLEAGGAGPSFWPWTMSGPNAHMGQLVAAFFRYDQGDRVAQAGEVVRVDIGCASGGYGADVGRTLPVSGSFTTAQAEAWDLLLAGYQAGLDAMRDGASVAEVRAASAVAVRDYNGPLETEEGVAARDAILSGGEGTWHIHSVGIEGGEDLPAMLRSGMVLAYEPGFSVGPDAYYLEDMILVTDEGHRVLSSGLPNSSEEIAAVMTR